MRSIFTLLLSLSLALSSTAQIFSDLVIAPDTFYSGPEYTGWSFETPVMTYDFSHFYNPDFGGFWASGWAMSTMNDTVTSGPGNLYASKAHRDALDYKVYAVGKQNSGIKLTRTFGSPELRELKVTNTTYAHNSMRDGDQFATAFGGADGDKPDYFLLTIFAYINEQKIEGDSLNFYLADYRFEDNTQDYIVNTWETISLHEHFPNSIAEIDSISFHLTSTDTTAGFFNTPLFFCIADMQDFFSSTNEIEDAAAKVTLSPNPTADILTVEFEEIQKVLTLDVLDARGTKVLSKNLRYQDREQLDVSALAPGVYFLQVNGDLSFGKKFIKK